MILTAFWTWLMSKFATAKTILTIILLVAVLGLAWYGGHKVYQSIYQKGMAAQKTQDDKVIAQLNKTIAQDKVDLAQANARTGQAKAELAAYVKQYNAFVAQSKATEEALRKEQKQIVDRLNGKIYNLNKQLTNAQTELTNAIPTLLPPSSSAVCQLSRGLVQLYNASLTGTDPSGGFTDPFGVPTDASAPSGVSCSAFAGYLVDNGIAAYRNRELLIDWQQWYSANADVINKAIKAGQATPTPVAPSKPALAFKAAWTQVHPTTYQSLATGAPSNDVYYGLTVGASM